MNISWPTNTVAIASKTNFNNFIDLTPLAWTSGPAEGEHAEPGYAFWPITSATFALFK